MGFTFEIHGWGYVLYVAIVAGAFILGYLWRAVEPDQRRMFADWWRGYRQEDWLSLKAKWREASMPGQIIQLTAGEYRALVEGPPINLPNEDKGFSSEA